jgi:putative iron-regulated protein
MKKIVYISSILSLSAIFIMGCKKSTSSSPSSNTTNVSASGILATEASNEIETNYNDLDSNAALLYSGILQLQASPTSVNLANCRQLWVNVRKDYEASEGYLFGPIVSTNIDPNIDTWPIDTTSVDSLLVGHANFTSGYVDSLSDAMKGFHCIEFILYGPLYNNTPGAKTAGQITPRQFQYMIAIALNVKTLTAQIASIWNPSTIGNYYNSFVNAGNGSPIYSDQRAALQDFVNGMISIADEVGNDKMMVPFTQHNASLEESHFADNSLADFHYNILGLQNAYYGKFTLNSGGGVYANSLSSFVSSYNLSLDNTIKSDIAAALSAIDGITVPFGQAITQQPTQVQNAINACTTLENDLQNSLLPFINKYVN